MSESPLLSDRHALPPAQRPSLPDTVPAALLFRGNQEVLIRHNGEHYRLRITKSGKLILTK